MTQGTCHRCPQRPRHTLCMSKCGNLTASIARWLKRLVRPQPSQSPQPVLSLLEGDLLPQAPRVYPKLLPMVPTWRQHHDRPEPVNGRLRSTTALSRSAPTEVLLAFLEAHSSLTPSAARTLRLRRCPLYSLCEQLRQIAQDTPVKVKLLAALPSDFARKFTTLCSRSWVRVMCERLPTAFEDGGSGSTRGTALRSTTSRS